MYTTIEVTPDLDAISYDNGDSIRIQICYSKYDYLAKSNAISQFYKEFKRLYQNSRINKDHSLKNQIKHVIKKSNFI